jgi:hypothetical protein
MSEQDLTPREQERNIRASIGEIRKRAEDLYQEFNDEVRLEMLFELDGENFTNEEFADVSAFGQYATKRLAAGALESPITRGMQIHEAFRAGSPTGPVRHDVLHAMWAWQRTKGRSLVPAYLKVKDKESQYTDPTAIQEELAVGLFDNSKFVRSLFSAKEPTQLCELNLLQRGGASKKTLEDLSATINTLVPNKGKDPFQYSLLLYEAYMTALDGGEVHPGYKEGLKTVQANRSPEYLNIFKALYDDTQAKKQNEKLMLNEFQKILAPLLARLRKEKKAA